MGINPARSGEPAWLKKALRRLVRLARRWKIVVGFAPLGHSLGEFQADVEPSTITISDALSTRDRINYMLHELGHAMIYREGLTLTRYIGFDDSTELNEKLALLDEEFEAWARARIIAKRMGIPLDESFERARISSMMSYVRWCVSEKKEDCSSERRPHDGGTPQDR